MPESYPHRTWVEIDAAQLHANLMLLRDAVGPSCTILLVVKSDAYGHGARIVASVAADAGIHHLAVATTAEGMALRRAEVEGEIIVLHPPSTAEVPGILDARLSPTISGFGTAVMLSRLAGESEIGVHIEINTGMNRLGLDWQAATETITQIAALPHLRIQGLFTHFRSTDTGDTASIRIQLNRLESIAQACEHLNISTGLCHAASSHALAYYPQSRLDGVRPGIMVYTGINGGSGTAGDNGAKRDKLSEPLTRMRGVMSVHAQVLHTRHVLKDEWIHYGEMYKAPRDMTVAIIPIGYGMGYPRALSNNADVLIRGRRVPVVGTVGMDMTIVDTSGLQGVVTGDPVTILGRDGEECVAVAELARRAGTIPYEVLCRLGNSLPRRVVTSAGTESQRTPARLSVP